MVYLECPHCKEITEHAILALAKDRVIVRCTECMLEWKGKVTIIAYFLFEALEMLFGKKCPKCKSKLYKRHTNPDYWMCFNCIKGYTNEELKDAKI